MYIISLLTPVRRHMEVPTDRPPLEQQPYDEVGVVNLRSRCQTTPFCRQTILDTSPHPSSFWQHWFLPRSRVTAAAGTGTPTLVLVSESPLFPSSVFLCCVWWMTCDGQNNVIATAQVVSRRIHCSGVKKQRTSNGMIFCRQCKIVVHENLFTVRDHLSILFTETL